MAIIEFQFLSMTWKLVAINSNCESMIQGRDSS